MERTRELWEEGEWEMVSEVMVRAVKDVCVESEKGVADPWVIGNEEEIGALMTRVNEAVNVRNDCRTALNARMRLGTRVRRNAGMSEDVWMTALEDRLSGAELEVRNARRELRRFLRRIGKR